MKASKENNKALIRKNKKYKNDFYDYKARLIEAGYTMNDNIKS